MRKPWSRDPPRWAASAVTRSHRARGGSGSSCALSPTTAAAPPSYSGADQIRRWHLSILIGGGTHLRALAAAPYSMLAMATASSIRWRPVPPCHLRRHPLLQRTTASSPPTGGAAHPFPHKMAPYTHRRRPTPTRYSHPLSSLPAIRNRAPEPTANTHQVSVALARRTCCAIQPSRFRRRCTRHCWSRCSGSTS